MSEITLSSAVRNNLLSLQNTANLLGKTQERLATGLKVNSALDDPSSFFTAASLNSRAGDLNRLLDSVGLAVQTIKAADEGISAITKLVESAQATARQALQAASTTAVATSTIDHSATGDLTGLAGVADGDQFSVKVGAAAAVNITIDTGDTIAQIATELSAVANVSATVVDGKLRIEATNGENLVLADVTNTPLDDLGLTAGTTTGSVSAARTQLETQFNAIRTQIDQLAGDASFNGNNLLNGDSLTVIFNEDGSSSLSITGVIFDSAGLSITQIASTGFQANVNVNAALTELDSAIATLRQQASTFGSNLSVVEVRQDFTKNLINTLETGAANLTLADTNEEGANLLALQTRQQLSSTALSLASQADQNVLRLFQ
jgi:flagellin-like hook-associated protein FlgL